MHERRRLGPVGRAMHVAAHPARLLQTRAHRHAPTPSEVTKKVDGTEQLLRCFKPPTINCTRSYAYGVMASSQVICRAAGQGHHSEREPSPLGFRCGGPQAGLLSPRLPGAPDMAFHPTVMN